MTVVTDEIRPDSTDEAEPERAARTLIEQARTALDGGFDGITISEHLAGFPGYVPVPTTLAATVLGATQRGWVAR